MKIPAFACLVLPFRRKGRVLKAYLRSVLGKGDLKHAPIVFRLNFLECFRRFPILSHLTRALSSNQNKMGCPLDTPSHSPGPLSTNRPQLFFSQGFHNSLLPKKQDWFKLPVLHFPRLQLRGFLQKNTHIYAKQVSGILVFWKGLRT